MQDSKFLVPLAIVVAGVLVAGAIYYGDSQGGNSLTQNENKATDKIEVVPVSAKDHILGNPEAEVVVVEYSDLECPFCKVFHNTMKEVLRQYDGRVAWVYRHFPLPQLHSKAIKEAEATECAAEQGGNQAFWKYTDKVFQTTSSNDSLDLDELPKIAEAIGLDVTAFNTCLNSGRHTKLVEKQMEDAVRAGARGTPYSIVIAKNGKQAIINGALPFEHADPSRSVKAKIDALLK